MRKILLLPLFFLWTCGGGSESPTESEQTIPLAANFTADPISGVHPLQVQFTSTSTGTINSYAWDVDSDSNIDSYSESFVHTYGPGTFSVSLTVSGPNGSNTTTKEDFINVSVGSNDSSFILSDIYSLVQNNMVRRIEWENYVDDPTSEQEGGGNSEIGIYYLSEPQLGTIRNEGPKTILYEPFEGVSGNDEIKIYGYSYDGTRFSNEATIYMNVVPDPEFLQLHVNDRTYGRQIEELNDGSYLTRMDLQGNSSTRPEIYLLDSNGNIINTYVNQRPRFEDITQLKDGNILALKIEAAASNSEVVRLSENVDFIDIPITNIFGNTDGIDLAHVIEASEDGGFILIGTGWPNNSTYKFGIQKYDSSMEFEWEKIFNYSVEHSVNTNMTYSQSEIKETSDQGFIFVTNMFENNWEYAKVIKVNNSGDFQWELDLDNHYNKTIDITSDGGFILGGSNYPHDSPPSANIIKINSSGNIEWNNLYSSTNSCERIMDGPGTQAVPGSSIAIDDNGFIMTGKCVYDSSEDDNDDGETYSALYVNKIDFNGNILWDKIFRYPQIDVSVFRGNDIEKDSEGNFVIVGSITHWASSGHRGLLIKIDSNGNRIF